MNIFCSSGASSTATRSEPRSARHEQESSCNKSSASSITPRLIRMLSTPCSSSFELAISPSQVEYKQLQKQQSGRKSSSSCYVPADKGVVSDDKHLIRSWRSSADVKSLRPSATLVPASGSSYDDQITKLERSVSRRPLPPLTTTLVHRSSGDELDSPNLKSSSSLPHRLSADKVVVLWVSLHCKGCEAKLKKHISRMEGVKSFSTDLATKRVTIISDMNPNDVLARVSRVKYAQFWPSSSSHDFHLSSSFTSY